MASRSKPDHMEQRFLNKTQQVLYQKEFKRANRIYEQYSQKGQRS